MALTAAVGQAQALDGSEAGTLATQQALSQIGRNPVVLGLVVASTEFSIQQVIHGVTSLLGEVPLLGFSSPATLSAGGLMPHSVAVALLAGSEVQARASWWPGFPEESVAGSDTLATSQKLIQEIQPEVEKGILLLSGDGLSGSMGRVAQQVCAQLLKTLPAGSDSLPGMQVAGCLAAGDLRRGRTYQIGGQQSGSGGIAAAYLGGRLAAGVGINHGWSAVGAYFKVSKSNGLWLRLLDERPASETYARYFGHRPREWGLPPLNELVRLYPLGIEEETSLPASKQNAAQRQAAQEQPDAAEGQTGANGETGAAGTVIRHLVRSPLRMENDGSLRLNIPVQEGKTGFLLVGSPGNCLEAARSAARQAVSNLKNAPGSPKPVLALVLVDVAWQMLLQSTPGEEVQVVSSVLGKDVPVIGGYTFGQIARSEQGCGAELFNQQIEVIVFGEPKEA